MNIFIEAVCRKKQQRLRGPLAIEQSITCVRERKGYGRSAQPLLRNCLGGSSSPTPTALSALRFIGGEEEESLI